MDDISSRFRRALRVVGFDRESGKAGMVFAIQYAIFWIMTLNGIMYVIYNWESEKLRMICLKGLVVYSMFGTHATVYLFNWSRISTILNVIKEHLHDRNPLYNSYRSERKSEIFRQCRIEIKKQNDFIDYGLRIYLLFATALPIINLLIIVKKNGFDLDIDHLPLLYSFYFPQGYGSVSVYLVVFSLQIWSRVTLWGYAYVSYAGTFNAMKTITQDIKLLNLSLLEMDRCRQMSDSSRITEEAHLKLYLKYVIRHHQTIYRKIQQLNKGISEITLVHSYAFAALICLAVYMAAQKYEFSVKLPQILLIFYSCTLMFYFGLNGEEIITEGDNFKNTMYEYCWMDKPKWFKSTLLIMMMRNSKQMKLQPLGLFVVNSEYFTMTVKAVYTYYNALISFKRE